MCYLFLIACLIGLIHFCQSYIHVHSHDTLYCSLYQNATKDLPVKLNHDDRLIVHWRFIMFTELKKTYFITFADHGHKSCIRWNALIWESVKASPVNALRVSGHSQRRKWHLYLGNVICKKWRRYYSWYWTEIYRISGRNIQFQRQTYFNDNFCGARPFRVWREFDYR